MENQLLIDYVKALSNLYGIVSKDKIVEIYNIQNDDKVTIEDIEGILTDGLLEDLYLYSYNNSYIQDHIDDEDFTLTQLLQEQEDKPYYIPEKLELLKYADEYYIEITKEYKKFENYVKKELEDNEEIVAGLCEAIQMWCEDDISLEHIIYEFESYDIELKNEEQLREVIDLVMAMANNTRIKENRGHTPNEIIRLNTSIR